MNSKGNRVILILVVGLASFTSAMRELNQIRQFGMEANHFIAQWTEKLMPAEVPPVVLARVESCGRKQSEPAVELPWLDNEPPSKAEPVKVKKVRRINVDPAQYEVRILNDHDGEQDVPAVYEFPLPSATFKFRTRKFNFNKLSPRDREILKTLNRSINLHIAS
jgi:hypothetical protein